MAASTWKKLLIAGKASIVDADINAIGQGKISGLTSALSGKVPTTRTVNGHALSSNVTITKGDVDLGSVDNTADTAKPVSTAQQSALNAKAPLASPTLTGTPTATTPSVGDSSTKIATTAFVANAVAGENELEEMEDVVISSVADNDIIAYNSGTSKYTNQNASELGIATVVQLSSKQDTIEDDDLAISHVSSLQTTLDGKLGITAKAADADKLDGNNSSYFGRASDVSSNASNISTNATAISNINTLIQSDEATLDTLQEVVDYIQTNRETLDTLGITNITGLLTALNGKSPYQLGAGAPSSPPSTGVGTFGVDTTNNDLWIYV